MKRTNSPYIVLCVIMLLIVLLCSILLILQLCTHRNNAAYTEIDPLFSDVQKDTLHNIIQKQRFYSPRFLVEYLKQSSPALQSVSVLKRPDQTLDIVLVAQKPIYCINNDYIVTDKHQLVARQLYDNFYTNQRPSITVEQISNILLDGQVCPLFLHTLHSVTHNIYEQYRIAWHNPADIWLYDKKNITFAIRCS